MADAAGNVAWRKPQRRVAGAPNGADMRSRRGLSCEGTPFFCLMLWACPMLWAGITATCKSHCHEATGAGAGKGTLAGQVLCLFRLDIAGRGATILVSYACSETGRTYVRLAR